MEAFEISSESEIRKLMIDIGIRLWTRGYMAANGGNISTSISENEILTRSTGVSKGFMTHDMILKMTMDGKIISADPGPTVRRGGDHGKSGPLHHPRLFFPGENNLYSREIQGLLSVQRRAKRESIRCIEWLAAMCSHVPNKGEQMVRYYGYYSNVSRGKRKKQNEDEWIPSILEPDESSKESRKNWARLIQKIL